MTHFVDGQPLVNPIQEHPLQINVKQHDTTYTSVAWLYFLASAGLYYPIM